MKRYLLFFTKITAFALLVLITFTASRAADGDTVKIRTFEFKGAKEGWFVFPAEGGRYEKILMNYKLKCPCAEWDYFAHIFLDQFYKDGKRVYYKDSTVTTDQFEIFRYITPYGNGLNLGNGQGFTWTIDVSDFVTLLHDSVYLVNVNTQEDLELTFDFIKGTPPRDVASFRKMWNFRGNYNKDFENQLPPVREKLDDKQMARLKIIQSGHGWDNKDNCAEFCDKIGTVKVNNNEVYKRHIWRNDCGMNPVYPQGGTWLLNRSNWCPGAEVRYYDYEMTDAMRSADSVAVDYDMEYYDEPVTGDVPNYAISAYLIKYGLPNFKNDAALDDIISPSTKDYFSRQNPICNDPVIIIRNTGANDLTSLDIDYGIAGQSKARYHWADTLKFLDTAHVRLPAIAWGEWSGTARFEVEVSNPNGQTDEYAANNKGWSTVEPVPEYPNEVVLALQTNKYAKDQYVLTLRNMAGEVLLARDNMADNTLYRDTLNLETGCYELILDNNLGYGLDSWFMRDQLGSGYIRLYGYGKEIKPINQDFGSQVYFNFTTAPKPLLSISRDTLDFGDEYINETKTLSFELTPVNEKGITINSMSIVFGEKKGFFFRTNPDITNGSVSLKYGEKMTVNIDFKPTKPGKISTGITIATNDAKKGTFSVTLIGNAKDPNSVDETDYNVQPYLETSVNPVSDKAVVRFSAGRNIQSGVRLALYNSLGREVMLLHDGSADGNINEATLDASALAPGAYYLTLSTPFGQAAAPVMVAR